MNDAEDFHKPATPTERAGAAALPDAGLPERLARCIAAERIDAAIVGQGAAATTAESAARILGVPLSAIIKTMVLTDGTRFVAAILPGDRRLDRKRLASSLGTGPLRFATPAEVLEQTGYPAGGVAPLGFARPMAVVVDDALGGWVIGGGGREDLLIRVAIDDIVRVNGASRGPICQAV
jgi:prolyl-tRNA editing enzyme YbaK/EbsC (Cys-tRNA(Pro) deacylase)